MSKPRPKHCVSHARNTLRHSRSHNGSLTKRSGSWFTWDKPSPASRHSEAACSNADVMYVASSPSLSCRAEDPAAGTVSVAVTWGQDTDSNRHASARPNISAAWTNLRAPHSARPVSWYTSTLIARITVARWALLGGCPSAAVGAGVPPPLP